MQLHYVASLLLGPDDLPEEHGAACIKQRSRRLVSSFHPPAALR